MNNVCEPPKRSVISMEIASFAEGLADRAENLAKRTHDRLIPVMMPEQPECIAKGESLPTYPPLFDQLRTNLAKIERSLNFIEQSVSRTEI